jgi:hypothetical protein
VQTWQKVGIGLGVATSLYFLWDGLNLLGKKQEAFAVAKSLASDKGILNLGAGVHRSPFGMTVAKSPEVTLNVDVTPDGLTNYLVFNLEEVPWPFGPKQFSVAFMSHCLEHLENWQEVLEEAQRVSDYVVLVLPHPLSPTGRLDPDHRQHFSFDDIASLQKAQGIIVYY